LWQSVSVKFAEPVSSAGTPCARARPSELNRRSRSANLWWKILSSGLRSIRTWTPTRLSALNTSRLTRRSLSSPASSAIVVSGRFSFPSSIR
jgi:hypothetical protein